MPSFLSDSEGAGSPVSGAVTHVCARASTTYVHLPWEGSTRHPCRHHIRCLAVATCRAQGAELPLGRAPLTLPQRLGRRNRPIHGPALPRSSLTPRRVLSFTPPLSTPRSLALEPEQRGVGGHGPSSRRWCSPPGLSLRGGPGWEGRASVRRSSLISVSSEAT